MNTNHEAPWILFRQKNPASFLKTVGIRFETVEQLMTNDAHVFFSTAQDRERAERTLMGATVLGKPAFVVERDTENNKKLFYRVQHTDPVPDNTALRINGGEWEFLDLFDAIVQRTGRHQPAGSVFSQNVEMPERISNHDVSTYIQKHYETAQ